MLQFILWVYPWVWCVFKNLWPFGFIVLSYLCSRDNHGRRSQSNFHFLCILGTSWTEATNFTCLQKIYVSCHSSSVLTSGNHGSQFLYRLQSNINFKMEKVPPYSLFLIIQEIEKSKQVYDTVVYEFFTYNFGDDDIVSDEESKGASELLRGLESN